MTYQRGRQSDRVDFVATGMGSHRGLSGLSRSTCPQAKRRPTGSCPAGSIGSAYGGRACEPGKASSSCALSRSAGRTTSSPARTTPPGARLPCTASPAPAPSTGVPPLLDVTDVLTKLDSGWKATRREELLPPRWPAPASPPETARGPSRPRGAPAPSPAPSSRSALDLSRTALRPRIRAPSRAPAHPKRPHTVATPAPGGRRHWEAAPWAGRTLTPE